MLFSINLEINIDEQELKFLKDIFLPDQHRSFHRIFSRIGVDKNSDYSLSVDKLTTKLIIYTDSIGNIRLTQIGHKVVDQFNRDKKIDDILNGT